MIINLKQINLSDSDNIKLDKVNYNFDQLVANGGGPMGTTGPAGSQGATGITGAHGYQGIVGLTGPIGTPGANTKAYWKSIIGTGAVPIDTIVPIHNVPGPNADPNLPISTHPPVVSVGFISTDGEYNNGQATSNGQIPYQWIINRRDNFQHNLRFTSEDVANNSFNFRMEKDPLSNINKFTMGFLDLSQTLINWHAETHIFTDNITGSQLLYISASNIIYYRDVEFDRPVTVNGQLKIGNAGAATDKIVVAADNAGTVIFKSIDELGGIVPYGTIVSILPSVFSTNSNFVNSETVTLPNDDAILNVSVGKGINDYAGWYICNGKTWKSLSTPAFQQLVPDMNSFSYEIQDNPNSILPSSQGHAGPFNNVETHLVGGADISMTANFINPVPNTKFYAVNSQVTTSDVNITSNAGTTFKIKKLPQIIYLGHDDCYWQDPGTGQAPLTINTYHVDDINNTATGAPTVSVSRTNQIGSQDIFTIAVSAASGYYFNTQFGVNWNPTSPGFTVTGSQPIYSGSYIVGYDVEVTATQGINGLNRYIEWNSALFTAPIPSFPLTLFRYTQPNNSTMLPPLPTSNITYDSSTGYTFDIIVTANNGYEFTSVNDITFTTVSPSPSAFTINSATFTGASVGYANERQVTLNVTLGGVPFGTTQVDYGLQGNPVLQGDPVDLVVNNGTYPLTNSMQGTVNTTIYNNSGAPIYIKIAAVGYPPPFGQPPQVATITATKGFGVSLVTNTSGGSNATASNDYWVINHGSNIPSSMAWTSGATSNFVVYYIWTDNLINGGWTQLNA